MDIPIPKLWELHPMLGHFSHRFSVGRSGALAVGVAAAIVLLTPGRSVLIAPAEKKIHTVTRSASKWEPTSPIPHSLALRVLR